MKKIYLLFLTLLITGNLIAADRYWVGGVAGSWSATTSWSATSGGAAGVSAPGANDAVFFDNGGNVSVVYDAAGNDIGLSNFSITNNTQVTLTNTVNATRSLTINNNGTTYYEVVAAGSSLTLQSNVNTVFNFGSTALSTGRMVFNGDVRCVNQAINTSNGPRLNAQDSIIINALFYIGPSTAPGGSNPTGSGRFRFSNTSVYQLDKNGGVIPSGKYEATSLIRLTGATTAFPSTWLGNGTYGSVEFNAPTANSATVNNIVLPANAVFQGNFTVADIGTSAGLRFASNPTNILIQGNLDLQKGLLSLANGTTAGTITVNGNFTQAAATTLDLQNSSAATTLNIKGNISSLGTITELGTSTASTIVLNGTAPQNVSFATAGITNDVRFQINNAAGIIAGSDWNIPNSTNSKLTLTLGNVNMGVNTLYIQNPSTVALAGGVVASHIIGKLRRATNTIAAAYVFPVSDNDAELAALKIYPAAAAGDYSAQFFRPNAFDRNAVPAPILNAGNYYWDITQNTGSGADINFAYGNFDNGGIANPAAVRGLHWNGSSWDNLGGTDAGGNSVDVIGITTFSPFTLGSEVNILPVSIEYFNGVKNGLSNNINWRVNCTNASVSISLQRSADGRNFSSISTEQADYLRCQQPFAKTDNAPLSGTNYYRLKIVDTDGKIGYSKIIGLLNNKSGFEFLGVMPNPLVGNEKALLNITSAQKGRLQIMITDANGKVVKTSITTLIAGSNQINLPVETLAAGIYQVTGVTDDGTKTTTRFVKN